ncbi:MAG: tRNA (adenosine(37)-N6)-dimethylallyltransferase MiaA [Lachnospiraceae bacterium]|nr:tRNA (adenosine(37)-N6)-dimethylallyltransferase MiaA [Lachnospiraceae bacterium]
MDKLIIIAGPTAVGKSAAAVELAKRIDGEIVSADSMQVYRNMDIGTAKITKKEMQGIPHHLLDILEPEEEFNVSVFQKLACDAISDINSRGKIPILTGGTGFYIQSVLYGIEFTKEDTDKSYRRELEETALTKEGRQILVERLRAVDPGAFDTIHENNIKRVIRALEFYKETGMKISEHNEKMRKKPPVYRYAGFFMTDNREKLYERIDKRVDKMMEDGLLNEVKALLDRGVSPDATSIQGLGYKEIYAYLRGECSLEDAVYLIKRDSRHFAKRQITWFKNREDFIETDRSLFEDAAAEIPDFMFGKVKEKNII